MKDYIGQVIEVLRRGHEPNQLTVTNAAAELATYRAAIASAESILRGFAMRGQEGDLQAAAEWLEKYGGLK